MFDWGACQFCLEDLSQADVPSTALTARSTFASLTLGGQTSSHKRNTITNFNGRPVGPPKPTRQEFPWNHLVAGATAGVISRTVTAPLELVRLQAMTGTATTKVQHVVGSAKAAQRPRLVDSLKAACAKDGWPGLWRGNGINVLRAGPQKAIDFFAFAVYKDWLGDRIGSSAGTTLLSAALAGATSTVVLQPLEVVRSRISCDTIGRYSKGIPAAVGSMLRQEGPLVMYTGLGSSLAAIMPEAAISYGVFDLLTKTYMRSTKKDKPGVDVAVAAGVTSACLAQVLSFPLETVARRLQVGTADGTRIGFANTVQQIYRQKGFFGFYNGFKVGVLKTAPMAALSFGTYELVRMRLDAQIQAAGIRNGSVKGNNGLVQMQALTEPSNLVKRQLESE